MLKWHLREVMARPTPEGEPYMSNKRLAELLGCSLGTVDYLIKHPVMGRLDALCRVLRCTVPDLLEYVEDGDG